MTQKYWLESATNVIKIFCQGDNISVVDRIPDMNMLVSFTIVQHVAHGMLLPLLLGFGDSSASCPAQPGSFSQHLPQHGALTGWETCWGLASAAAPCVQPCAGAKGEQARTAWLSSTGCLCASSVPSFPSSAEEFKGCCC